MLQWGSRVHGPVYWARKTYNVLNFTVPSLEVVPIDPCLRSEPLQFSQSALQHPLIALLLRCRR